MSKVGFGLSPWSTHGELRGIKGLSQIQINRIAKENFEKEMKKHKSFFRKFGITILIYTDSDLDDYDTLFNEIQQFLTPIKAPAQLRLSVIDDFLNFGN